MKNDKYISLDELELIFHAQKRSIVSTPNFPNPSFIENGNSYYDKDVISKFINIDNIDEPFIDIYMAAKILNIPKDKVASYSQRGLLPNYRLKNSKGSKFLFKETEIIAFKEKYCIYEKNGDFFNRIEISKKLKNAVIQVFFKKHILEYFGEREVEIFVLAIDDIFSYEYIAEKYGVTKQRICQIVNKIISKSVSVSRNFGDNAKENVMLRRENIYLNRQIDILKKDLMHFQKIENSLVDNNESSYHKVLIDKLSIEFDDDLKHNCCNYLSIRTKNILRYSEIRNVGDLIMKTSKNISSMRGVGYKVLNEIRDLLKSLDLKFINEYENESERKLIQKIHSII